MNVWWVLVFIVVALSPLAWLAPSRSQLGSMETRQQARRMGLSMQLSRQDWPHWFERPISGSCAQYFLVRRGSALGQWCYWQVEPGKWLDKWREPCLDPTMLEQLQKLPDDAFKVEAGAQLCSVYWGERGGPEALQHIHDFLKITA